MTPISSPKSSHTRKEHIILAFKKAGNVVGYLGDGINDASALHAADVGISVDSAADVAKEAADIVLQEKSLDALIECKRRTENLFQYAEVRFHGFQC